VEIARIVLASVTEDVISFRVRRRRGGRRIRYRVVDEYPEKGQWRCRPASSSQPLTLGQIIELIDGTEHPHFEPGREGSLTEVLRDQDGCEPDEVADFVNVESDFYHGLSEYFNRRAKEWLERKISQRREEGYYGEDG
jgi:hypothetical protein